MKIQNLAIIFIIIILPISIVLSSYMKNRMETISLQSRYDSKLNDATHDAIKAYQINSFTNDSNALVNSKIRDIEASVNTFFNSLATNFSTLGYTKETLQNYVPAIVYAMYDGYYIYSPYTNTWYNNNLNNDIKKEIDETVGGQTTYKNDEKIFGLQPYVFYSCRYKKGSDIDVVITYSLDNYVQIQGEVKGKFVSQYGYLYSYNFLKDNGDSIYFSTENNHWIKILDEGGSKLKENIFANGKLFEDLPCIKENGTKYYKYNKYLKDDEDNYIIGSNGEYQIDTNTEVAYSVLNGKFQEQSNFDLNKFQNNDSAKKLYKEAIDLRKFIVDNGLDELKTDDIVDIKTGKPYEDGSPYYSINGKIFDFDEDIESETSNFNTHRIDVIKNSIERNLSIAIANFNNYYTGDGTVDFKMPKLKDEDWDKIMNNISVISFMQGMNIGGKVYNGYSVITNTMNEDVVMEDSIYIKSSSEIYNIVGKNGLDEQTIGIFNINTEPRLASDKSTYFLPVKGKLSYDSIITKNGISDKFKGNLKEYIKDKTIEVQRIYYTALARERYGLYRPKLVIK